MDVISYALSKKYTDEKYKEIENDLTSHLNSTMPHIFYDLKNNKKYRYGRRLSENGIPQIISEEVIE